MAGKSLTENVMEGNGCKVEARVVKDGKGLEVKLKMINFGVKEER